MQKLPDIRVLFIDDNQDLCNLFQLFLESDSGFQVHTCTSALDGLLFLADNAVDAIISDYAMPEMDGILFLKEVKKKYPEIPFIILTGEDSKETAIEALNSGADFYQNKGEELDIQTRDIGNKIRLLVSQRSARDAVRRKDAILEAISYAADQFLKGNYLHIDSREILGRLGRATGAERVILYNNKEVLHRTSSIYDSPAIWPFPDPQHTIEPSRWPEQWKIDLSDNRIVIGSISNLEGVEAALFHTTGVKSILILPIYANSILCGYLVFEDQTHEVSRSPIEIQSLRMAAEVIGSARYRRHIEEFYKFPVEEAILGVFLLCGNSFRYVNPRLCTLFGYEKDELLALQNPVKLIHPADKDIFLRHILMTFEGIDPTNHFECTGIRKDGREIYLDIYLTAIRCQDRRCVAGNLIDVTDRRMMQQSLLESEQRYRTLAEQIDDLILVLDSSWEVTFMNPAAREVFSNLSLYVPDSFHRSFSDESYQPFLSLVLQSMNDGEIRSWSMTIPLPDGRNAWFDISISPLKVDDTQVSSMVITFHDVSDRVSREEEIRKAGLAQLELNMEQFQILNDEIRNPIQVIKGLNLMQGGEYAERIDNQLSIINDLIDKLDRAWVQSEKVHAFLLRHYQHGLFIDHNES